MDTQMAPLALLLIVVLALGIALRILEERATEPFEDMTPEERSALALAKKVRADTQRYREKVPDYSRIEPDSSQRITRLKLLKNEDYAAARLEVRKHVDMWKTMVAYVKDKLRGYEEAHDDSNKNVVSTFETESYPDLPEK